MFVANTHATCVSSDICRAFNFTEMSDIKYLHPLEKECTDILRQILLMLLDFCRKKHVTCVSSDIYRAFVSWKSHKKLWKHSIEYRRYFMYDHHANDKTPTCIPEVGTRWTNPKYDIYNVHISFCCSLPTPAWLMINTAGIMMTSSNGSIFRATGHLCGEFTGPRWIPLTKASDADLMFSLICARINGWVNNRKAGDLGRHWAHYDVILMIHMLRRQICYCTYILLPSGRVALPPGALLLTWINFSPSMD